MSMGNKISPHGVLLMAYGSPGRLEDVPAYYTDIRGGKRPDDALIDEITKRYRLVGGKTPLTDITTGQARALQKLLDSKISPGAYKVYIGMKHWQPTILETVRAMVADGIHNGTGIVLAPHYSGMSIGGYAQKLDGAVREMHTDLSINLIPDWHTQPAFIDCICIQITDALRKLPKRNSANLTVLFTAHSLPKRILSSNDPYKHQLLKTASLVASKLSLSRWSFSFQSAGHTPEPWLGPDVNTIIHRLSKQGVRQVLVCPIGFVADNLEILYDIDIEAHATAVQSGMTLQRTESRNTHPLFIEALYSLVTAQKKNGT